MWEKLVVIGVGKGKSKSKSMRSVGWREGEGGVDGEKNGEGKIGLDGI